MNINPSKVSLESLLSGLDTKYRVPEYQRDYSWTHDQHSALWSDLHSAAARTTDYFMGTLVLNLENKSTVGGLEIVDGQQRLATFSILAAAIRDRCRDFLTDSGKPEYSKIDLVSFANKDKATRCAKLVEQLLLHSSEPDHYYLDLNEKDQTIFYTHIQQPQAPLTEEQCKHIPKSESRIIKAKKFFTRKLITEYLQSEDAFCKLHGFVSFLIKRLIFLKIEVVTDNDAYLLFESLNDRGLDLSVSDLVKNRLLHQCGADGEKRKRILELWDSMALGLSESRYAHPLEYIRIYWAAFETPTTKKELYGAIKTSLTKPSVDVELFTKQLSEFSIKFADLTDRDLYYPSSSLKAGSNEAILAELNTLGYSVCYPFLLRLVELRPTMQKVALPYIRDFLFRLITIGNFAANRAEKAFQNALAELKKGASEQAILGCLSDTEITDDAFALRFKQARFEDNNIAKYVLAKLHDSESTTAVSLTKDAHLEHILPQDTSLWSFDPGVFAMEDCIYSIGNMILLEEKINKRIQNSPFPSKVSRYERKNSGSGHTMIPMAYRIHEEFSKKRFDWTAERIRERAAEIAEEAKSIWPLVLPPSMPPGI
jgi:uncharacterized protein with ParB-like and HNH nuclease domain